MNDRCAAGTGRFLEVMANTLEVPIAELGILALRTDKVVQINSQCTVFAESEVISLIARGEESSAIARTLKGHRQAHCGAGAAHRAAGASCVCRGSRVERVSAEVAPRQVGA